jgi:hypothetical protein
MAHEPSGDFEAAHQGSRPTAHERETRFGQAIRGPRASRIAAVTTRLSISGDWSRQSMRRCSTAELELARVIGQAVPPAADSASVTLASRGA